MRINKHEYYLNIAKAVSLRSTCLRKQYGAIIVKNDETVSTGYNGSPRGCINCCDYGKCERKELNIPSGKNYELCSSIHAESNCIISAGRNNCIDSELYLYGYDLEKNCDIENPLPCNMCLRIIKNSCIACIKNNTNSYIVHDLKEV
jgi:dCMP deaminase